MRSSTVWTLIRDTYWEWSEDNATLFGAALAFFTFFSLAPLLIIAIAVAGFVFGPEAAEGEVVEQIQNLIGRDGAEAVQALLRRARESGASLSASLLGLATLLLGASRVFTNLQTALNVMWEVPPETNGGGFKAGVVDMVEKRIVSFAMVLATGFLLLASLLVSAVLAAVGRFLSQHAAGTAELGLLRVSDVLVSFGVVTLLFAVIYKFLPDVKIDWRDVWFGAVVTSLLFTLGKLLIGWYLGNSTIGSVYGAAGSLVIILLWVYYSSQILLFGAEMTQVYAKRFGSQQDRTRRRRFRRRSKSKVGRKPEPRELEET